MLGIKVKSAVKCHLFTPPLLEKILVDNTSSADSVKELY